MNELCEYQNVRCNNKKIALRFESRTEHWAKYIIWVLKKVERIINEIFKGRLNLANAGI